ncbi:DUF481 domain-containing protein [Pontibacter sp. JAM-7]|uniref:DUF481 domain-containing protein n=1 Tax=Pontibacter sp. JAM-7 TaxID=3366581 RepID=UPI003AF469D8
MLTLQNGDTLTGEILQETDSSIQFQHPTLGTLTIPRSQLKPAVVTAEPQPAAESADTGLLGTGFLAGWKRSLAVGLNGATGNSDNHNLHVGLALARANNETRKQFNLNYDIKQENGEQTENDLVMQLDNDYLMPGSQWFWFHRERLDWDKLAVWDYRFGGHIGAGYDFINTQHLTTSGRLGIGGTQTWGGPDEGFSPELLIGAEAGWTISQLQSLSLSNTLYPSLENTGEYRNITRLDWAWKLSDLYKGIALKLGMINEYESDVAPDTKHNDFKYHLSLDIGL